MSNGQLWVSRNPRYEDLIDDYLEGRFDRAFATLVQCSNCGGTGRHIYIDPTSGQMRDLSCQACGGAGQKDNGDGQ